ncbi:MAG: nucleotidyltransferase domain-containing protein [Pseudomonadota bacterium]
MTSSDKEVLEKFKTMLRKVLDVSEVILFGSRARGDADEFSDMDVIVVVKGRPEDHVRDYVGNCAWEAGLESGIVIVPIVFSEEEWAESVRNRSLLGIAVTQDGMTA